MSSYREINYKLRPAKNAERKMLCEAMRRLSVFSNIESYSYVGFGSTYYSDFSLFHRALGVKDMTSIEQNFNDKQRFEFNKPYACITNKFNSSNYVLPRLTWKDKKYIFWLDYDKDLNTNMIVDLNTFIAKAEPGSMVIISFKAQMNFNGSAKEILSAKIKDLETRLGKSRISNDLKPQDISPSNLPKYYYKIITEEIIDSIQKRNGGSEERKFIFKQLINFVYSDGVQMQTIGGIIIDPSQQLEFEKAKFNDLSFIREGDDYFKIEIPSLTFKEIGYLDSQLHGECDLITGEVKEGSNLHSLGIPPEDIKKYVKIYRYFPTFAEAFI